MRRRSSLWTLFGVRIGGLWAIVAPAALMVFGYAVLFTFASSLAGRVR